MRKVLASLLFAAAVTATGCGPHLKTSIKVDQVNLGRVVVYRNGVAFYERRAVVEGGQLTVTVPRDRVDDFLKSLTVVDAHSQQPLPVSFPRQDGGDSGPYVQMTLQLPVKDKKADVVLTYVTESPAWKPSYRIVVGEDKAGKKTGRVLLEGWAIVDNTSAEDWDGVVVGVGSSSALSFRYDLWSVRNVQRETLAADAQFAVAPPLGVSPYASATTTPPPQVAELTDDEIRRPPGHPEDRSAERLALRTQLEASGSDEEESLAKAEPSYDAPSPMDVSAGSHSLSAGATADSDGGGGGGGWSEGDGRIKTSGHKRAKRKSVATRGSAGGKSADAYKMAPRPDPRPPAEPEVAQRYAQGDSKLRAIVDNARKSGNTIVVEGVADANRGGAEQRAVDRANIVRNQLIDAGIPPGKVKVTTKVVAGQTDRVRLVQEVPTAGEAAAQAAQGQGVGQAAMHEEGPVGESNFESIGPMSVGRGTSAMVSMVRAETDGDVVYLYDAESERGNDKYAFKAVRLTNPTDSTLETGPVTVYGSKRFIGEGLSEPIPPRAMAVVPFALDRQIVIDKDEAEDNQISRLVTLQRGILTAEVQHIKRTTLTLTNRSADHAKVFVRHTVGKGWIMKEHPDKFSRVGDAHLFELELAPGESRKVALAEATPLTRTLDLNSEVALDMMKIYVEAPEPTGELRDQLKALLGIHRDIVDGTEKIVSLRRRQADYRTRMDELHGQLLTLQAVKTGGELVKHLKDKMKDISNRVQKSTIEIVDTEEKLMLARVRFQDSLAELKLGDVLAPAGGAAAAMTAPAAKAK
jgi:DNA-binding protein